MFYHGGFWCYHIFTLSGFLISYLLIAEKQQQEINVKNFYFRGILRIWPLYYLYLAAVLIVIFCFGFRFDGMVLLSYIFFGANFPFLLENIPHLADVTLPFLRHYWSLGVEEQFYLVWPWAVKKIKKKIVLFVVIFIAAFIAMKLFSHLVFPKTVFAASFNVMRFDCMLMGSLGAIYYYNRHSLFLKITTSKPAQAIAWSVILLLLLNIFHIASIIDHEIIFLSFLQ